MSHNCVTDGTPGQLLTNISFTIILGKSSLTRLAPELLGLIASFVTVASEVSSLSLVSRPLRNITEPYLYSTISC